MYLAFATLLPLGVAPAKGESSDDILELIAAAQDGSSKAASRLYELHVTAVYRTVRPLCRNEAEAEDTVQEAFARAFESLDRYVPQNGSRFVSWLLTIALNVARKTLRKRKKVDVTVGEFRPDVEPDETALADVQLDRARTRRVLLELLTTLPERDREILTLRYGGELAVAEVATISRTSEANVRKICERNRRRLLERLEAALADPPQPQETQP